MEYFCAYQERCYKDVEKKLYGFLLTPQEHDEVVIHLHENNFINEERFAKSFARGKHNYKHWGKLRITRELKARQISNRNIQLALNEIPDNSYSYNFNVLAEKQWYAITEKNCLKKKNKWVRFLLQKGYESDLIYDKLTDLSKSNA